ncbi:MAG TPA: spore photoproduct lyase, partial [Clostridia bacterium]|nr:spore photoproduct lyase [Clostridia bacterium]
MFNEINFHPTRVYYEADVDKYEQGKILLDKFETAGIPLIPIETHNNIAEIRSAADTDFPKIKDYLVLGIRKSHKLMPNPRSADYIVPFTSSGCGAMCTYCYLVCTFFKSSNLRIFVNREQMMDNIERHSLKTPGRTVYELGSNSDMVFENAITGNLEWAIERIGQTDRAFCTFSTKFSNVDPLLKLKHNGRSKFRVSLNPAEIIKKVEFRTSRLPARIEAANKMYEAGYYTG